jgi:hypothetical protein
MKAIVLFLAAVAPCFGSWAEVTANRMNTCTQGSSGTQVVCTLPQTPTTGAMGIVYATDVGTGPVVSNIQQTGSGCTWTKDEQSATNRMVSIWRCSPFSGGANTTVTINFASTISNSNAGYYEFTGALSSTPLDVGNIGSGNSTTPSPGAVTPTTTSSLIFGAYRRGGTLSSGSPSSGCTYVQDGTQSAMGIGYCITTSTSSVTMTFTVTSTGTWDSAVAVYKGTSAAAASMPPVVNEERR